MTCKKCGSPMVPTGKKFMGTKFGKGGHENDTKQMSQWTVCSNPKCKARGIIRF